MCVCIITIVFIIISYFYYFLPVVPHTGGRKFQK